MAVVYATDFGDLSAGGILSFLRVVGAHADPGLDLLYVGFGDLVGELPRRDDSFVSLGRPDGRGSVNGQFTSALRRQGHVLDGVGTVIIHRPEHALGMGRLRGKRLVLMLHGGTWNAWRARRGVLGATYPALEAIAATRSAVTLAVAPTHLSRTTGLAGHVVGMPTTYDANAFHAVPRPGGARRRRLLLVGRLVPEKRFELALRAAAALGEQAPRVEVFGSGPECDSLRSTADDLGLQVTFHGFTSARAIAAEHQRGDGVLMLTSRFEGFPVAALEAAACGTPVVGLAAPGITESLATFGGHVVAAPALLPEALRQALRGEHEIDSAQVVARFGPSAVSARFWDLALHG